MIEKKQRWETAASCTSIYPVLFVSSVPKRRRLVFLQLADTEGEISAAVSNVENPPTPSALAYPAPFFPTMRDAPS